MNASGKQDVRFRLQLFRHVQRQGNKIEAAPGCELGKIQRCDKANAMSAHGQPGRKRNSRLNVAARAKGEHTNLHSGNLLNIRSTGARNYVLPNLL